ncbi:IS3 family transposase [Amycolatopsis sp. GA6-003]|uniref:IS3 family transposase n=1 Tax=Amycolatopsis sp. GA6-003 TaxID=2652444 RepID=UPI0039175016
MSGSSKYSQEFRVDAVALARSASRPLAQVARELGVNHETLRTWVRAADRADQAAAAGGDAAERELRQLRKRVAELEKEKEIPRKAAAYFAGDGSLTRSYRFISDHRAAYGVARLCRVLEVRRPGFYEWLAAAPAREHRAREEDRLAGEIAGIHAAHRGAYGSPRITAELRRRGETVNHKRVERVMRERGITGITRRKPRSLTRKDKTAAPAPDLIGRDFTADAPGQRLVGDITCLPTDEGWLCLATVLDPHTREIVGHALAPHMRADLVRDAITLAADRGLINAGAVFHSDRGTQYASTEFRATLAAHGIRASMGRTGSCYDNAAAESFFATLKTEIGTRSWTTRHQARHAVFAYLAYYNHHRLHSTLNYRTPHETRTNYSPPTTHAA